MEREHLMLALREALRESEPEQNHPIIEQAQDHRYWGRKTLLLSLTALSFICVIALYFILNNQLDNLIDSLIG